MAFFYENEGTDTLLIYQFEENDLRDSFCYGMLENNKIDRVAPINFSQNNDICYFKYNISSKISASKFFAKEIRKNEILNFFKNIVAAILDAQEYMILATSFVINLDYIFIDASTYDVSLICLPLTKHNYNQDIASVFKQLLFTSQFSQYENGDYVVKLISYLNSTPNFSLNDFGKLAEDLLKQNLPVGGYEQPKPESQPIMQNSKVDQTPRVESMPKMENNQRVDSIPKANPVVQPSYNHTPSIPAVNQQPPTPGVNRTPVNNAPANVSSQEDNISLLKLLSHYSKENKEKYNNQKMLKKEAKQNNQSAPIKQGKQNKAMDFQIPGGQQPAMVSYAPNMPVNRPSAPVNRPSTPSPAAMPVVGNQSFGNTTVLSQPSNAGQTTVLSEMAIAKEVAYLIRCKNNEKIYLIKNNFKLGSERNYVEYCISDNTAISRNHAMITQRADEHFVMDMNSTNHSYINGRRLDANQEIKLSHNDRIRLANEEFIFYMM